MAKKQKQSISNTCSRKRQPSGRAKSGSSAAGSTIVLTTLALGAAGVLSYLGWQYMKKRKQRNGPNLEEALLKSGAGTTTDSTTLPGTAIDTLSPLPSTATPPYAIPDSLINNPVSVSQGRKREKTQAASDDFPLRRGSKGDNVRILQEVLIKKYGAKTLPRYGADGDFGSETTAALKKLKMPATVSETFFNVLTQGNSSATSSGTDLSALAPKIYNATLRRDFNTVLSLLKNIKSSEDYSTVSESFKQYRLSGVRKTLVTGLLDTFSSSSQKQQLRLAFATMGLVYDGSKWGLAGLDGVPIVTIIPAKVWVNASRSVTVPAKMILGHEIARKLQYVMFVNNGRHFLVHSNCIKHL
jgi:hypothetical protein